MRMTRTTDAVASAAASALDGQWTAEAIRGHRRRRRAGLMTQYYIMLSRTRIGYSRPSVRLKYNI